MTSKNIEFWQIIDVFESVDGTMFTVWDYRTKKRRTLRTKQSVGDLKIGDLVEYSFKGNMVSIKPVDGQFRVPPRIALLIPVAKRHEHTKLINGGIIMEQQPPLGSVQKTLHGY
jgi:hypothetical protein